MNQSYGTTSACAENTLHGIIHDPQIRNYLRVRGEYGATFPSTLMQWNYLRVRGEYDGQKDRKETIMELPPRARRIQGGGVPTNT